jgi:hypothetical protein
MGSIEARPRPARRRTASGSVRGRQHLFRYRHARRVSPHAALPEQTTHAPPDRSNVVAAARCARPCSSGLLVLPPDRRAASASGVSDTLFSYCADGGDVRGPRSHDARRRRLSRADAHNDVFNSTWKAACRRADGAGAQVRRGVPSYLQRHGGSVRIEASPRLEVSIRGANAEPRRPPRVGCGGLNGRRPRVFSRGLREISRCPCHDSNNCHSIV